MRKRWSFNLLNPFEALHKNDSQQSGDATCVNWVALHYTFREFVNQD